MQKLIVDTNILIHYLIGRDETIARSFQQHIERVAEGKLYLLIPGTVVAEVVYVLIKHYSISEQLVTEALLSLVTNEYVLIEEKGVVETALHYLSVKHLDFADCYILALADAHQCLVLTHDKKLKKALKNKKNASGA